MSARTIGSLFSGIGGLELGLEWAGVGHTVWQVEQNEYCRAVLAKHWPDATRYEDVKNVGRANLVPVDVICGGFPCQDISLAGSGAGLAGARSGLWFEYARIIRELRPRYVVAENVPGLLTSDDGRFFNRVLSDLAAAGYDAEWDVLSAEDVGAPQFRERVITIAWRSVADADGWRFQAGAQLHRMPDEATADRDSRRRYADGRAHEMGDAGGTGRQEHNAAAESGRARHLARQCTRVDWSDAVPVRGYDGTVRVIPNEAAETGPESSLWPVAPGLPGRVARLRAIGNAVVPQVAEVVGRVILELERQ